MINSIVDPSNKSLVLYEPSEEVTNKYRSYFLERYNTDLMRKMMNSGFHSILMGYDVTVDSSNKDSHLDNLVKRYKESNGGVSKNIMAAIMAVFVSDIRNMTHYMEILPPEIVLLMKLVASNHIVSHTTLEKETGRSWLVKSSTNYGPSIMKAPELVWIECTQGKCSKTTQQPPLTSEYYFYMDIKFRPIFMPFAIPMNKLKPQLSETLPDLPEPLQIFNAERQIFSEIPVLNGLYRQGSFAKTDTLKVSISVIKKMGARMKMKEFHPGETDLLSYLRASMVIAFYNKHMTNREEINDHPELIIKEIFQKKLLNDPAFLLATVLPHITGLRSLSIRNAFGHQDILEFCGFFFDHVRDNYKDWINFEHLLNRIMLAGVSVSLFSYHQLSDMPIVNKLNDYPVDLDNTFEEITVSFFKGFLYLMAAFGIAEIAHTPYKSSDASPFSCLRYFRLTKLGLYVFGFAESYTLPDLENKEQLFELDDKNLIARSLTNDNPYELLLAEMSEPIGNKRYHVTLASMLKSCHKQDDTINKIEFFKRFISNDLPQVWKDFFKTLEEHNQPMEEQSSKKYIVYQLNPANEELIHLLSTDPLIRKYTHRAEDYLLVVDGDKQKDVVNRLKSFGYLLNLVKRYY